MQTRSWRNNLTSASLFVRECLRKPGQMGAVAPSSAQLARAMARWVEVGGESVVLELGPGSGPVTAALVERGLGGRVLAIERSPAMTRVLQKRFPSLHVVNGDAWELDVLCKTHARGAHGVGAVVSSLPLVNFPPAQTELLARKILAVLRPGGCWIQFSYNLAGRRPLGTSYFHLRATHVVWWNLPPARVSVYQKRA